VVRPGGIVLLAVPDMRYTFDAVRPATSLQHLFRDNLEGPNSSRRSHYEEWVRLVEGAPEVAIAERAACLEASGYRIHFHVWDFRAFAELLHYVATPNVARVSSVTRNRQENLGLLVRTAEG
jgi:hypothetical protein